MTAEEFLKEFRANHGYYDMDLFYKDAMVEFAKYHLEQAKTTWFEKIKSEGLITDAGVVYLENAYSIENIK